jgi:hypothetical protein
LILYQRGIHARYEKSCNFILVMTKIRGNMNNKNKTPSDKRKYLIPTIIVVIIFLGGALLYSKCSNRPIKSITILGNSVEYDNGKNVDESIRGNTHTSSGIIKQETRGKQSPNVNIESGGNSIINYYNSEDKKKSDNEK